MDNLTRDQVDEPSDSTLRQQDQANHSVDGQVVKTQVELYSKRLELNAKRLGLNGKQLQLNAELLKLYKKQRELDAEQLELNGEHLELTVRTNVNIVFEIMSSASANIPVIPVVDAPADDSTILTTEQLLVLITAPPIANASISPCLPIAALPCLLVAALPLLNTLAQPAARPTAAQERKRSAPPNQAPESLQASKRYRTGNDGATASSSRTTYEHSDDKATSKRLLAAIKPCIFVEVDFVSGIYRRIHSCSLMPPGVKPKKFIKRLAKMDGLEHWVPRLSPTKSKGLAGLNFLRRRDLEPETLRLDVLRQLGLAEDLSAVVLGPRLCYALVAMCGIRVDQMSGPILSSMFSTVTGEDLHLLNMVTQQGVRQMTANSICQMVKSWVSNLSKFISDNGGLKQSLVEATKCNDLYATRCSDTAHDGPGSVGAKMLKNGVLHSKLFLGNQAAEMEVLSKRLFLVASRNTSAQTKACLKQLAVKLQIQPNSS